MATGLVVGGIGRPRAIDQVPGTGLSVRANPRGTMAVPRMGAPGGPTTQGPILSGAGAATSGAGGFSDLLQSLVGTTTGGAAAAGGGGGAAATPGVPGAEPVAPDYVLKAEDDPFLKRQAERIEGRLADPEKGTQRLIEQGVGAIRDLGTGQEREARAGFERLGAGVGESGGELEAQNQIKQGIASAGARAASDITTQRARDFDQLLLGSTGALGAVGEASRAERGLGQRTWAQLEAARRAREELEIEKERVALEAAGQKVGLVQSILGLYSGGGGGGGYQYHF